MKLPYPYRIKIVLGFRQDQEHSIEADEIHKAYYLFLHPEERGIFSTGLAILGSQIKEIVPDIHGTMGWNPLHKLDTDDINHITKLGIDKKLRAFIKTAKELSTILSPEEIQKPLTELLETKKYKNLLE